MHTSSAFPNPVATLHLGKSCGAFAICPPPLLVPPTRFQKQTPAIVIATIPFYCRRRITCDVVCVRIRSKPSPPKNPRLIEADQPIAYTCPTHIRAEALRLNSLVIWNSTPTITYQTRFPFPLSLYTRNAWQLTPRDLVHPVVE